MITPRLGDTIRYLDYDKIKAFDPFSAYDWHDAIFVSFTDNGDLNVLEKGKAMVISKEYLC